MWGALVPALDAFLVLHLMQRGFRYLEAFVASLLLIIFGCLGSDASRAPEIGAGCCHTPARESASTPPASTRFDRPA